MKKLSWLSFVVFLAVACQDHPLLQEEQSATLPADLQKSGKSSGARIVPEGALVCDEGQTFPLLVNGVETGLLEVDLDPGTIYVDYDLTGSEWYLLEGSAYAGDCNTIPEPGDYPYSESFPSDTGEEVRTLYFEIPMAELPDCGCIRVSATVARFNPSTSRLESEQLFFDVEYCDCEPDEPDDDPLRTQTPGGWGAPPNGNNPGAYLHANFSSAFPGGLVVGCDFSITLTSAQAVTNFLPQGGTPAALTQNYIDPVNTPKSANNPKNVLASHVTALKLSVTFDAWDEDFGESGTSLADAVVASGDFEGWTVAQVLAEAEKVLGGCASPYSAAALTEVLSAINECYVDGTTNTGFLINGN